MAFVNISEADMVEYLTKRGFVKLTIERCLEAVYGREMGNGYTLAVFTGIEYGVSRKKGKDAIRVALMHSGKVLTSLPHVKRVTTWKENLTERLRSWRSMASDQPCPDCGGLLVLRRSKRGSFYGCAKYPACRGKRECVS
jgi:hypothetical protein